MCPPVETSHVINDYPHYYDPLYFPHLHRSIHESSHNFCTWLASALDNHRVLCHRCPVLKNVCVFYDGMIVRIACNGRSVTMSLQALQSAQYQHCTVLLKIANHDPLSVSQCLPIRTSDFPSWFLYSPELVKLQLMSMSMNDLVSSACASGLKLGRSKNIRVNALHSHIMANRRCLCVLSSEQLVTLLKLDPTSTETPSNQPSNQSLVSLVSSYFLRLYGSSVAFRLRFSPVSVYSFHGSVSSNSFPWLDRTVPELTQCLNGFSVDMLTSIIRALPPYAVRPPINTRSCIKTAQGLVSHVIHRTCFLLSVGSSVVADLYLARFPSHSFSDDHDDEHYVLAILQCEYTSANHPSPIQSCTDMYIVTDLTERYLVLQDCTCPLFSL